MADNALLEPFKLGPVDLANRVVMAPLTRSRADGTDTPKEMHVEYYCQRASAGLIISEATQISKEGKGYAWTPGIYSDDQVKAWTKVVDAVHEEGGKIIMQLWHVGRISHPDLQEDGQLPVSASDVKPDAQAFTENGFKDIPAPRALETDELPRVVTDYVKRPRTPGPPASTASKCIRPMAICSTSSCRTAPTSARTPMAARSKTVFAFRSR